MNNNVLIILALTFSTVAQAQQPGESFKDCPYCPEMVMIPAGEFMMGAPSSEVRTRYDFIEEPRHEVTISYSLAVGKYEITEKEYSYFVEENNIGTDDPLMSFRHPLKHPLSCGEKCPARNVSWHEAKNYTTWLSMKTGHNYRLLSEAEWEYTARAGTQTHYHWGNEINKNKACYNYPYNYPYNVQTPKEGWQKGKWVTSSEKGEWEWKPEGGFLGSLLRNIFTQEDKKERPPPPPERPKPPRCPNTTFGPSKVGSFPPNNFGIHDMHGNVSEWVEDCFNILNTGYVGAPTNGQAWFQGDCDTRMVRGGSWLDIPLFLRSASRLLPISAMERRQDPENEFGINFRSSTIGFRVARTK